MNRVAPIQVIGQRNYVEMQAGQQLHGVVASIYEPWHCEKNTRRDSYLTVVYGPDRRGIVDHQGKTGITGSPKIGETDDDAARREFLEETGLYISASLALTHSRMPKGRTSIYRVPAHMITTPTQADLLSHQAFHDATDDRNRKVQIIVHGTEQEITDLITRVQKIRPLNSLGNYYDEICGLAVYTVH
jgi:hypothetical protein